MSNASDITSENTSPLPSDEQLISCESCLSSVPLSEASVSEAADYITYFCGLECYDVWVHQKKQVKSAA